MRWLGAIAALGAAICAGMALAFPTYTHRFRLTVEVDTPHGVRSGSSMVEVDRLDQRWVLIAQGRYVFRVRGEAVFVDLGGGRNVVALLGHGPQAENKDQLTSLWVEAYGRYKWDEALWSGQAQLRSRVELKPPLIPTLATVLDLSDPNTVHLVRPDEFETVFGRGVRFRGAWLEVVPAGWQLARLFGLSDMPPAQGIQQYLPWVQSTQGYLNGDFSCNLNTPQCLEVGHFLRK